MDTGLADAGFPTEDSAWRVTTIAAGWLLLLFVTPVVVGELVATAGTYAVLFVLAVGLGVTGGLIVWQMAESGRSPAPA
jgi:hypothetical protein